MRLQRGSRGVETPLTPDESDEVGAGDVVETFGVDGLAKDASSASDCWWFEGPSVDEQLENSEIENPLILFVN